MISGKKKKELINFLLVFTSVKLFRASAEPVQQSIRNSLGNLMYSGIIFQDMSVFKSFPKNLGLLPLIGTSLPSRKWKFRPGAGALARQAGNVGLSSHLKID